MTKSIKSSETPLMKQHNSIKSKYPDAILLFRVGDFYETFGQDAIIAANVLGITLTKRANGTASHIELAGFPHFSLDNYLHKLVKAGYRVAICDQLEDPKQAKGIVKRGVTELVTPGLATNEKLLENKANNFLASLYLTDTVSGITFLDISTGEFFAAQGDMSYMEKLIQSFLPSEIILAKGKQKSYREKLDSDIYIFAIDDWIFQANYAEDTLRKHFNTQSLKGFGIDDMQAAIIAAGATIHYLKDTEHSNLNHITSIQRIVSDSYLWMDRFTIRNLELLDIGSDKKSSLLDALDHTQTSMGARLLKRWMLLPLFDLPKIQFRLNLVEFLIKNQDLYDKLKIHIKQIGDVERLIAKVPLKKINPRELLQLAKSMEQINIVKQLCITSDNTDIVQLTAQLNECLEIQQRIINTIDENAPAVASKGFFIKTGVSNELDNLQNISKSGKDYLLQLQQSEIQKTGITSLKISFNNVFGYYLEVTNTHKDKVPTTWIRKQTLTNAERYITPELKEYEEKILGAEEKILAIELELYQNLLSSLDSYISSIQHNAYIIAQLDCLVCFAHNAIKFQYRKPILNDGMLLDIKEGRHPVIEQQLPPGEAYVANDILLDKDDQQIIILTGPNMSGKSALLRQTAIITIMAHMGSFVPASHAIIGVTDKIFTRVGASDNLSGGESTFMVEMNETASIINNLSERSLILLDEIGRGTSTYDGISIAWSIIEFLQQCSEKPKTLFATHYHELNELEVQLQGIKNFHITHRETASNVIFLRKLAPGGSRHSFGIQVAKMAGMPLALIERASEILELLEKKNKNESSSFEKVKKIKNTQHYQLNIFDGLSDDLRNIQKVLQNTDINTLTPVEALMKLNELKSIVKEYH